MKKSGIIDRIVRGKPRDKDLTVADLPSTRPAQFKFVMRTRFGVIFRTNLLAALFWIPFFVWMFAASSFVGNFTKDLTLEQHFSYLIYLALLEHGVMIPMFMLGFTGLGGMFYTVKRVCWGQSVRTVSDFGRGVKENWRKFVLLGLIAGVANLIIRYFISYSVLMIGTQKPLVIGLVLGLVILLGAVLSVMCMYAFCMTVLYDLTFFMLIKNSFILAFKKLWSSLGICLLSLVFIYPFALMPWILAKLIGMCLAVVFSIGFAAVMQTVFCHGVFDKYINEKNYPECMRIGLADGKMPEELSGLYGKAADGAECNGAECDGAECNGSADGKAETDSETAEAEISDGADADENGGSAEEEDDV